MAYHIRGGRVIDPINRLDKVIDLYIDKEKIVGLGRRPPKIKIRREIDASGLVVCPGFVDLDCHLREPGYTHKATIASEAQAAAGGGFTTICAAPSTLPVADTPTVIEHINQRAEQARGARVLTIGALTVGLQGAILAEMLALKNIGCVALSNCNLPMTDTAVLRNALAYAASCDMTVFLHPEDAWLGSDGRMHEGLTSTILGIPGIPEAAETIAMQRDLILIAKTGVRAHFCGLSSGRSLRILSEARRSGLPVSADISILNLLLSDLDVGAYDANCHLRPPLRDQRDRSKLRKAIGSGAVDAICAHHEPHDAEAKAAPFSMTDPGASTLDAFLPNLLALVEAGVFELSTAIAAASTAPHRILNQSGGDLALGSIADLCVFDPGFEWTLSEETMLSRGKNSPFLGQTLRGKNRLTIVAGRIVFDALK